MPTTPLLPLPDGLDITAISETEEGLLVRVTATRPTSLCPVCSTPSSTVHSSYRRKPRDLPCTGQPIRLLLSVRKFFRRAATCPRKIFTEQLPELIKPSSRLTTRLRTLIQAIKSALNGKGGARLGEQIGFHFSRMTFLRALQLLPTPAVEHVRVVGLDDFAWKRGARYGTIILDLETHTLIDMLPDREAESVKIWLEAHPEIEFVSRDRAGAYADGAARGAPQALQIADKWHLAKNLGDAVEDYVKRKRLQVSAAEPTEQSSSPPSLPLSTESSAPVVSSREQSEGVQSRSQRQDLWEQAHRLHEQGYGVRTIAKLLGLPLPHLAPKSSPRQIRWLLAKKREALGEEERAELARLLKGSEEGCLLYRLLQAFLQMIRERHAEHLDAWIKEARSSRIKELLSFVAGIERDYEAVKAGLTLKWSQGPVEGTVNKLKVHKRLMYGRAGFPLLRQKMLHCS